MQPDKKKVFIIHGRNTAAKNAVEQFVRALGLEPIEFGELAADMGASFVGEIVRKGMEQAQGIIALFTDDEISFLRPDFHSAHDSEEHKQRWQSRPNVIFEAGMAFGNAPKRTILAIAGVGTKLFSDVNGIHLSHLNNDNRSRSGLRQKLIGVGCSVNERTDIWTDPARSGDFEACVSPEVDTTNPFLANGRERATATEDLQPVVRGSEALPSPQAQRGSDDWYRLQRLLAIIGVFPPYEHWIDIYDEEDFSQQWLLELLSEGYLKPFGKSGSYFAVTGVAEKRFRLTEYRQRVDELGIEDTKNWPVIKHIDYNGSG